MSYKHDFAMLTCSFSRDMKRCFNAYQSYEKFFVEKVPYYLCVPEHDLEDFNKYFLEGANEHKIDALPTFISERQLIEMAGEPVESVLALPGYYLQDAIRLSFGLTGLSKHYFMNDSDGYFIKKFNLKYLYKNGKLMFSFHEVWHAGKTEKEMMDLTKTFGLGHGNKEFIDLGISYFDIQQMIKTLLNSHDKKFRNFTCTPSSFDSEVICELHKVIQKNGLKSFTNAIRMIPFAFQWYGEFLVKKDKLISMPFLFFTCEPHVETWKVQRDYFEDPSKFGIQYQSVDYSQGNGGIPHDRIKPNIFYVDE